MHRDVTIVSASVTTPPAPVSVHAVRTQGLAFTARAVHTITPPPNYPQPYDRHVAILNDPRFPLLPAAGACETSPGDLPSISESRAFAARGDILDQHGRPVHPWLKDMMEDPNVGVATGRGKLRRWGANQAADPIVTRDTPDGAEVLLIRRSDTGMWALPGGFCETGEDGIAAAIREAHEETGLSSQLLSGRGTVIYSGPVADPRATANAWIETTAVVFHIGDAESAVHAGDDAAEARWVPMHQVLDGETLYGSHDVLVREAMRSVAAA